MMGASPRVWIFGLALVTASLHAQPACRFYLANHTAANQGVTLSLEGQSDSSGKCQLSGVTLVLAVADGTQYRHVTLPASWQTGVVYTVVATVTGTGPQQVSLNGGAGVSFSAVFQPAAATFYGSVSGDTGTASEAYVVTQISLQVTNGSSSFTIAPNGANPIPLASMLISGPAPWPQAFAEDPSQTTTIRATFRFDNPPNPLPLPFIDTYGQLIASSWPQKILTDSDLAASVVTEQAWLASNPPPAGLDPYGGSTVAGWSAAATGYYSTAFHNNRWWLISPQGNPLFYVGLSGIDEQYTPITGRESMFQLPPQTSFPEAYAQNVWGDKQATTYVSYVIANLERKYGSTYKSARNASTLQRLAAWGFTGAGKWTHTGSALPVTANPVLTRTDVPNLTGGSHPDVWDPAVLAQLTTSLTAQITPNLTNPNIIGWSVGNEKDEIIGASEVTAILNLGPSVPAKVGLVQYALTTLYGGSVSKLAGAWGISALTVTDVYAAKPTPPAADLEALRQQYESKYYAALYQTVTTIDKHHLYLGNWILPRTFPVDWPIIAANCDVIGMDLYAPALTTDVLALINQTKKPVLIGEFSFPSGYGGMRGFGASKYTNEISLTDSQSGDWYMQYQEAARANPYIVGVEWFEYRDEPVSGRGNNDGTSNVSPPGGTVLLFGENYGFGLTDVTDQPKYELANKVRASNLATLQSLGLINGQPEQTRFVPIPPCRVADTRNAPGPFGGPSLAAKATRDFAIPNSACGIPANATAYSLNVAVVPPAALGYLTMWPSGQPQPLVATLNSDGRIKSNAAIIPAGANGAISLYVTDQTDVVLDINGYFVPSSNTSALGFYPITPCRVADTRNASGPLGGPALAAGGTRTFPVLSGPCGIPSSAQAYSLNFAAVPKGPLGYLTAWPAGQAQPTVASLNALTGTITANAVIVPAGSGGSVNVFSTNATDLVIDADGYFAPMGTGGLSLYAVTPCRVLDSRLPAGTPPFATTLNVNVAGSGCGVPATAQAYVFSATVVPPGPLGYITLWPEGQPQPTVATLNAVDGALTSNLAIVPSNNGSISVFPSNPTHLVLDLFGYFAP